MRTIFDAKSVRSSHLMYSHESCNSRPYYPPWKFSNLSKEPALPESFFPRYPYAFPPYAAALLRLLSVCLVLSSVHDMIPAKHPGYDSLPLANAVVGVCTKSSAGRAYRRFGAKSQQPTVSRVTDFPIADYPTKFRSDRASALHRSETSQYIHCSCKKVRKHPSCDTIVYLGAQLLKFFNIHV